MSHTEFILIKLGVFAVIAFIYGFIRGGSKRRK